MSKRILYLQYTNPAAYPPLIHSAEILAEQGWSVLFLAIAADGARELRMPTRQRIQVAQIGGHSGGSFAGTRYAVYAARALQEATRFRPDWLYASDAYAAPVALLLRDLLRVRVLYHEHDVPQGTTARGLVGRARNRLARTADIVVAPAAPRLELIPTGRGQRLVVWNCPRREEVTPELAPRTRQFRLVYHGSLSRERLMPQLIDALSLLPEDVVLDIYGYETAGHRDYVRSLLGRAEQAGIAQRVHYHGVVPERADMMRALGGHQLGISTVALESADRNLRTLAGASNKAFEYLAAAMPLLISRDAAWHALYGAFAQDCIPDDAASIAAAIRWLLEHPGQAETRGRLGRARILADWNYETQFAPVLQRLAE